MLQYSSTSMPKDLIIECPFHSEIVYFIFKYPFITEYQSKSINMRQKTLPSLNKLMKVY